MHIVLTGGGSGGHIFPLIAVARRLRELADQEGEKLALHYVGPGEFGREFLAIEKIKISVVAAGKWRRYASFENVMDLPKIFLGALQAFWKLFWIMPDIVFSKGGYGSLPTLFASRLYRIPVFVHESDTVPGLANRYAAKFAKKIFVSFEKSLEHFPKEKTELVGNPIREELIGGSPEEGKSFFDIRFQKPVILVLGGSQGAEKINEIVLNTLPHLLERYEVIHQCGRKNFEGLKELVEKEYREPMLLKSYHLYPLLGEEEYRHALAASDLVISRAGSSIFEIAAAGRPSIIIPLSTSAANHQLENAYAYRRSGACTVLDEQNLTPNLFLETIAGIAESEEKRLTMAEAARAFAKPDAARRIAEELFRFVERR